MNTQYSFGDFTQQSLADRPAAEFAGEIVGSCFQQEVLDTEVFPVDAAATFLRCNLNNCKIPAGCTIGSGSVNHQHEKQNDGEQWVLDKQRKPTAPLNAKVFDRYEISKGPEDIPALPMPPKQSVTIRAAKRKGAIERIAMNDAETARLKLDHDIDDTTPIPIAPR